ncbi:amidohydrolase family protein [Thiocapsa sp.]|uniref:amidohydrolase family protein n=1 Tax=Thiocapsa sp. TaxID=2024551 RepID=UPI0025F02836|nr:amidohydrolase family protein [Thiocapsa sp.]
MIIDSHCHAGAGFGLRDPWTGQPLFERYLRRASAAGITHSALFANFNDDYAQANRAVARLVASNRRRFFGLAYIHTERDRGRVFDMIRIAVECYGFVGIKVHRHDARISRELCEAARAFALPVLYDVETELGVLDTLTRDFPDLPFIVPHLSSFAENWRSQTAFLDRLQAHDNLYTDSSGVRFFDLLARVVEHCGPRKLLFGSDGPWLHPGVELTKIKALGLSPADEALVLGGNFLRLIGAGFERFAAA